MKIQCPKCLKMYYSEKFVCPSCKYEMFEARVPNPTKLDTLYCCECDFCGADGIGCKGGVFCVSLSDGYYTLFCEKHIDHAFHSIGNYMRTVPNVEILS